MSNNQPNQPRHQPQKQRSTQPQQQKKETVFAFIDSQNLNLGIQSQGWTLDWRRFRQYLRDKYHVEKAYLFIGMMTGNESLYTFLQECGFLLVFKPVLQVEDDEEKSLVKGNVDAELVLHAMIHLDQYDQAVIVSGDGDFYCLIDYLKKRNKLKKVLTPNARYSSLLRKFNEDKLITSLARLRRTLSYRPRRGK